MVHLIFFRLMLDKKSHNNKSMLNARAKCSKIKASANKVIMLMTNVAFEYDSPFAKIHKKLKQQRFGTMTLTIAGGERNVYISSSLP